MTESDRAVGMSRQMNQHPVTAFSSTHVLTTLSLSSLLNAVYLFYEQVQLTLTVTGI